MRQQIIRNPEEGSGGDYAHPIGCTCSDHPQNTKQMTTYCNKAKGQVPTFKGYPYSHVWRPPVEGKPAGWGTDQPCYCDKLFRP